MSETVSAKVPINIRWTQELVDDGKGGSNFYMRLTPKIATGGRYTKGTSTIQVANLLSTIQRLKRERSNEIQRAAKYGVEQAIRSVDYNKERQRKELAEYTRMAKAAEETRQANAEGSFNIGSSMSLQKAFEAEMAANPNKAKNVQFEKEEQEEKETEEIYYIK